MRLHEGPAVLQYRLVSTGAALEGRRLYLCTADRSDLSSFLRACIRGGVDVVQLRDKALDARALVARASLAASVCADHGVPFLMNDRPDLALEAGADGVHVGQDDVSAGVARRILGSEAIVGLSTHALSQLHEALTEPVDYLSAGPVVPTPTKPGRPGTGHRYAGLATRRSPFPVFVTGGVSPSSLPELARAGARRFVVVRWLTEAEDPGARAAELRSALDRSLEQSGLEQLD